MTDATDAEYEAIGPLIECRYCGEEYAADCWDQCPFCLEEEDLPQ